MSCTAIQTDSEEKTDINTSARSSPPPVYNNTSARSSPPPVYTPAQLTEQPQSHKQQQQYVIQPQPYMYPGAGGQMIIVPPRPPLLPKELRPNDYLIVTLIVAIMCGLFNITSLMFSIPALICSVMAFQKRNRGFYTTAKNLGVAAIILDLLCVTWVVVGGVIAVGVVTAYLYLVLY